MLVTLLIGAFLWRTVTAAKASVILSESRAFCPFKLTNEERRISLPTGTFPTIEIFVHNRKSEKYEEKKCLPNNTTIFLSDDDLLLAKINGKKSVLFLKLKGKSHESKCTGKEPLIQQYACFAEKVKKLAEAEFPVLVRNAELELLLPIGLNGSLTLFASLKRFVIYVQKAAEKKLKMKLVTELLPKFQHRTRFILTSWPSNHFQLKDMSSKKTLKRPENYDEVAKHFGWKSTTNTKLKIDRLYYPDSWSYIFAPEYVASPIKKSFPFQAETIHVYIFIRGEGQMRSFRDLSEKSKAFCIVRMDFVRSYLKERWYDVIISIKGKRKKIKKTKGHNKVFSMKYPSKLDISKAIPVSCCIQFEFSIPYCKAASFRFISKQSDKLDLIQVRINDLVADSKSTIKLGDRVTCVQEIRLTQFFQSADIFISIACQEKGSNYWWKAGDANADSAEFTNSKLLFNATRCRVVCAYDIDLNPNNTDNSKKFEYDLFMHPVILTNITGVSWTLNKTSWFYCRAKGIPNASARWIIERYEGDSQESTADIHIRGETLKISLSKYSFGVIRVRCEVEVLFRKVSYIKKKTFSFFRKPNLESQISHTEVIIWNFIGIFQIAVISVVILIHIKKRIMTFLKRQHRSSSMKYKKLWITSGTPGSLGQHKSRGTSTSSRTPFFPTLSKPPVVGRPKMSGYMTHRSSGQYRMMRRSVKDSGNLFNKILKENEEEQQKKK